MAITFGAASTTVITGQNPSSITPTMPTGITFGQALVLFVAVRTETATVATPTGWTALGNIPGGGGTFGASAGPSRIYAFTRVATATSADTLGAVAITGANMAFAQVVRYTNATGGWSFGVASGSDSTVGTAWSVTCDLNPGLTAGDHVVVGTSNGQAGTTWSAQAVSATGVTAWSAFTEINEFNSTTGSDINGMTFRGAVTTGTATAVPIITATAAGTTTNTRGVSILVRLREAAAPAPTVDAGLDASHSVNTAFTRTATESGSNITGRSWTITSGPAGAGSQIGTAASLSWTPTTSGVYVIRYSATNSGGTGFDEATITVVAPIWNTSVTDRVATMTGVAMRLRAADLGTIGGGSLANNAAVTTWTSKAGPNATGSGTFVEASLVNNRPAVRFNGTSNDFIPATGHAPASSRSIGFVWAARTTTAQDADRQLIVTGSFEMMQRNRQAHIYSGASAFSAVDTLPLQTGVVWTGAVSATANETLHQNGTVVIDVALSAATINAETDFRMGSFSGRWLDGDISEFVIWDHVLTPEERATWHSYVQDAYGVTVSDYSSGTPAPAYNKTQFLSFF